MAALPAMRQLGCLRSLARTQDAILPQTRRWISTTYSQRPERVPLPPNLPEQFRSQLPSRLQPENGILPGIICLWLSRRVLTCIDIEPKPVKVYPPPPSTRKACKDPVAQVTQSQLAVLDPKGERKALFDYRRNARSIKPGDIVRVTFKNGDPFNGVVLSIKLRGIDTSFLLRNELSRTGVEMSVKVFNPNVSSVEIVQRAERKPRRARLYYMRFVDLQLRWLAHDLFSVLLTLLVQVSQARPSQRGEPCVLLHPPEEGLPWWIQQQEAMNWQGLGVVYFAYPRMYYYLFIFKLSLYLNLGDLNLVATLKNVGLFQCWSQIVSTELWSIDPSQSNGHYYTISVEYCEMARVAIPLVVNLDELQHVHLGAFRLRPLDLTTSPFQLFRLRPGQFMFFCGLLVPGAMVSSLVLLTAMVLGLSAGPEPVTAAITSSLQSILRNTHGSKEYDYPTDITRDILPVSTFNPK